MVDQQSGSGFSWCFCPMGLQLKWQQWSAIFSSESQVTNIVNFVGRRVCVATTQLCCEGARAAMVIHVQMVVAVPQDSFILKIGSRLVGV